MAFQGFIANIALLILIIALVVIGVILYRAKGNFVADDVVIGECPDYWTMEEDNKGTNYCLNVKNLGKSTCSRKMNFGVAPWSGIDGTCKKYTWANACDLTWDGITNNPNACAKNPPNK